MDQSALTEDELFAAMVWPGPSGTQRFKQLRWRGACAVLVTATASRGELRNTSEASHTNSGYPEERNCLEKHSGINEAPAETLRC